LARADADAQIDDQIEVAAGRPACLGAEAARRRGTPQHIVEAKGSDPAARAASDLAELVQKDEPPRPFKPPAQG
jgi:hypothetical protein